MAIVLILVLIVVGSVVFHLLSPWWWTPIASNWTYIDNTIIITFWITGIVFVAVVSFMAYCVFRFRHRPGNQAMYEPENRRLEIWLAVGNVCRRCRDARARPLRVEPVHHRAGRCTSDRGRRPAVAVELPAAGSRRTARESRYP